MTSYGYYSFSPPSTVLSRRSPISPISNLLKRDDFPRAIDLASSGRVNVKAVVTHRETLHAAPEVFEGPCHANVARIRLSGKMAHDDLVFPPSVSARDHPARRLALCAFHAQLSRRRRSACGTRSGYLLRNGAAMGIEVRAIVRPRTLPAPAANDAMASRRDGRDDCGPAVWLWRAVDDEGEVLDPLVQRRRDKAAAVKLMGKLLKKQGFAPEVLVTDKAVLRRGNVRNRIVGTP